MPVYKKLRYRTIADILRDKINKGDLLPGKALPSQKELASIFNTSVMTVRQALAILEEEGLISSSHGVGTFVASGEARGRNIRLQGFTDEMEKYKVKIITKVLGRDYSVKNSHIKEILGKHSKGVCCLLRIRLVKDNPIILQRSYLPLQFKEVIKNFKGNQSLYACLSEAAGTLTTGREIIIPVSLPSQEAELLRVQTGTPAFLSYRISYNILNQIILFDEAYITGRRVSVAVKQTGRQHLFHYAVIMDEKQGLPSLLTRSDFWEEV